MMKKSISSWGGPRDNSGRKETNNVYIHPRISQDKSDWLYAKAKELGVPIGYIVENALDAIKDHI